MINDKITALIDKISAEELPYGLYIVATDIGNPADITLRAINVLNRVDFVICEDWKSGSRLLKQYGIVKNIEILNEHNEKAQTAVLIERMMLSKIKVALISDAGTPLFADPGGLLVQQCLYFNIPVFPVPGASSLMAALMVSAIRDRFLYHGFLPANREDRVQSLYKLRSQQNTNIIFLETPYRLPQFLRDLCRVLGGYRNALIAYKMTTPEEQVISGTLDELLKLTDGLPKGEFVFVLFADTERRDKGGKW